MSCIPLGVNTAHHRVTTALCLPARLCHHGGPARVCRGAVSPTLPPETPHREQPLPVLATRPRGMPALRRDPQPGREKAHGAKLILPLAPAHTSPCQHKHGTLQPAQLIWKRQCWPSRAQRSQPRGRMWGRRGPSPTSNTLTQELAPGEGEGLEKGTHPMIGAKRDGNPRSRGQPACWPEEYFCT